MLFYTLQNRNILNTDEDVIKVSSDFENPDFKNAYSWLKSQYQQRINPSFNTNQALIWGWPTYDSIFKEHEDNDVVIVADLPESRVLTSDFQAWHMILNNWTDYDWNIIFEEKQLQATEWLAPDEPMDRQFVVDEIRKSEIVDIITFN